MQEHEKTESVTQPIRSVGLHMYAEPVNHLLFDSHESFPDMATCQQSFKTPDKRLYLKLL